MRRALSGLFGLGLYLALMAAAGAQAPWPRLELPEADRTQIRRIVEDQIAAFLRDDGAAAFGYASPDIQAMFKTPEVFMDMVRNGYRTVYRPRAVQFQDVVEFGGQPAQVVRAIGPDGVPALAVYPMRRQPDGSWRIDGCMLFRLPGSET